MEYVALGKTKLMVSRTAFGAVSLENCSDDETAVNLIVQAYEGGINFFDTDCSAPNSERRLGLALQRLRQNVKLATKSAARSGKRLAADLARSLNELQTDYVDLFQYEIETTADLPVVSDDIRDALMKMKSDGLVHYIGIVSEDEEAARALLDAPFFDTLQFPFSVASSDRTVELVRICREKDIGFLAMQPLCGGIIRNIPIAYGYLHQWENIVPLWGVANSEELQQILYFESHPPVIDDQFKAEAEKIRNFFN